MVLARTGDTSLTQNLELKEAGSVLLEPKPEEGNGRVGMCQVEGKAEGRKTKASKGEGEAQRSTPWICG